MCTFLGTNAELVEDAVKYIIFLVDADRLFDTALGMYDFSLVLLVAQYSQKVRRHLMQKCLVAYAHQDPREYLPFLRSLRALEGAYQHFKIDDHLKRHAKALRSLHLAGAERFEEAKTYVEKHALYADALELWKEERATYEVWVYCV
jgi:elongator complex protein 1